MGDETSGRKTGETSWDDRWSSPSEIDRAGRVLREGGLVAFPTETVYGLGADATSAEAVERIFAAKGRPSDHPLIVHVAGADQLDGWVDPKLSAATRSELERLTEQLWPGPLTVVVPRGTRAIDAVTGGRPTVGLRVPDHPVAQRLLRSAGVGVAAPSANRFGRVSPTTAADVAVELGSAVDVVLDGGPCGVGLESTIVELVDAVPVVLRPGGVPVELIEHVLGREVQHHASGPSRASGMLASHYAPTVAVRLVAAVDLLETMASHRAAGARVGVYGVAETLESIVAGTVVNGAYDGADVDADGRVALPVVGRAAVTVDDFARHLYRILRGADDAEIDVLLVVPPAETGLGAAVVDRLRKAAAPRP